MRSTHESLRQTTSCNANSIAYCLVAVGVDDVPLSIDGPEAVLGGVVASKLAARGASEPSRSLGRVASKACR